VSIPVTDFQIEEGWSPRAILLRPKVPLNSRVLSLLAVTLSPRSSHVAR
jgi:hypothetical protein